MARDRSTLVPLRKALATKLPDDFPEHDSEGTYVVPTWISEHFSTCMTVETDLVNQFSGLLQLETSIGTAFLLVCLCLACLTTMLHQIVSEASAAAKNRTSNV